MFAALLLGACGGDGDGDNQVSRRVCETFWPNLSEAGNNGADTSELEPLAAELVEEAKGASASIQKSAGEVRAAILSGDPEGYQDAADRMDVSCEVAGF